MKELVVISGKGGTGKTSVTAAFAALAQEAVLADCDVDAAGLHLVLGRGYWKRGILQAASGHRSIRKNASGAGRVWTCAVSTR